MLSFRTIHISALAILLAASVASAQTAPQSPDRDSLWNGALIGAGAGLGATAALDATFCNNGFGGCDFPWAATLMLGGIGAAAGAGIDFLIHDGRVGTLRLSPIIDPARRGVVASLKLPHAGSLPRLEARRQNSSGERRDSIWNGTLIGAGIGAAGGVAWGMNVCGSTDDECFAITGPVGLITGAGIGAAVGAIADALHD